MGTRSRTVLSLLAVLAMGLAPSSGAEGRYQIIVHPGVKGTQIPRTTLSSIFQKKAPRWGDGSPVLPVDQSMRSPVRQSFAADVLQQPMVEVQMFWSRRMARGVMPPPVKQTDEDVVKFVAATPGAIGYVSSQAELPDSVRSVAVVE